MKLHYAVEKLDGRVMQDRQYVGADLAEYWRSCYGKYWRPRDSAQRSATHDGLQHVTLQMKDEIGWEPFRKTLRYFRALPPERRPKTPWQQFRAFHDKLGEFSGHDVWSYFTAEDLEMLKRQYTDK